MPGESSRINGRKGGRPKGSENEQTKIRRMMQKRWIERIYGCADRVFEAHLALAMGNYEERTTHDGILRVYHRSPNPRALEWIMEHVWGKTSEYLLAASASEKNDADTSTELTPQTKDNLHRALKVACSET